MKKNTACNRIKHIFYATNSYLLNDPSLESLQKMEPKNEVTLLVNEVTKFKMAA